MGFNLRVLLYIVCILLTVCVLSWCLLNTSYYATMLTLTLILAAQIAALLRCNDYRATDCYRYIARTICTESM